MRGGFMPSKGHQEEHGNHLVAANPPAFLSTRTRSAISPSPPLSRTALRCCSGAPSCKYSGSVSGIKDARAAHEGADPCGELRPSASGRPRRLEASRLTIRQLKLQALGG